MKKLFLFGISLLLGLLLVIWIYQQIGLRDISLRFGFLKWHQITALFLLTFCKILIWIFRWRLILKTMGFAKLPFKSLAGARLGEMALSYLTPGIYYGGEVVRVFALKKSTQISLPQGLASVIADRIIEIASFGVFAFIGVIILIFKKSLLGVLFFTILGLLPLLLTLLVFKLLKSDKILALIKFFHLNKVKIFNQNNGNNLVAKVEFVREDVIKFFKRSPRVIFLSVILSCLGFCLRAIQIVLFVMFLGEFCPLSNALLMRILTLFSGLIPIPATLGVYEGVSVLAFQEFKLTAETGLSFTLMTRLIDFSFVMVGLFLIAYYLTHHLFSVLDQRQNNNHNDSNKQYDR